MNSVRRPADLVTTDRLDALTPTARTTTRPQPALAPAAVSVPTPRRRTTSPPLGADERALADALDACARLHPHHQANAAADLARHLGVDITVAAAALARVRAAHQRAAAAQRRLDERAHGLRCAWCTPAELCAAHLAPLQDLWDARDDVVRQLCAHTAAARQRPAQAAQLVPGSAKAGSRRPAGVPAPLPDPQREQAPPIVAPRPTASRKRSTRQGQGR